MFKLKRGADGSVTRHKARLVAKGYTQTQGVDFEEVFSPVAHKTTIRSLLSYSNSCNLHIHQMDVKTAFLYGVLDNDLFMEQPEGFVDPDYPQYVCKLKKGLYGLKQSARCWNNTLDTYLKENDYRPCNAYGCLYIKTDKSSS